MACAELAPSTKPRTKNNMVVNQSATTNASPTAEATRAPGPNQAYSGYLQLALFLLKGERGKGDSKESAKL